MKCPVCGSDAENKGSRDYGDKDRIECPRCGPYEISGTALAMLRSRLGGSPTAPARLSHALRLEPRKDGEWFMVTSANIDELVSRPLPDVERQMNYLLVWLSVQVGDDHLGFCPIDRGTVDELAGVVGAVDGERVDRLLEFAVKEGLIEIPHSGSVGITPKGWEMLTGEKQKVEAPKPEGEVVEVVYENDENTIVKANCNICGGTKKSFRRRMFRKSESDDEVSWSDTMEILECCGCGNISMRHKYWFSEWDDYGDDPFTGKPVRIPGIKVTLWPPATSRTKPEWADRLEDEAIRTVLDEVYSALDQGLAVLAAIGTRTLLDRAMLLVVGDPENGFEGKLKAMVAGGRVGEGEKETFLAMVDVGSAATHRGYVPDRKTLNTVLSAAESLLHREFILPKDAEAVRKATPARPKKNTKADSNE